MDCVESQLLSTYLNLHIVKVFFLFLILFWVGFFVVVVVVLLLNIFIEILCWHYRLCNEGGHGLWVKNGHQGPPPMVSSPILNAYPWQTPPYLIAVTSNSRILNSNPPTNGRLHSCAANYVFFSLLLLFTAN